MRVVVSRFSPISIDRGLLKGGIAAGEAAVRELLGQELALPSSQEDSPFFRAGVVANGMEPYIPSMHMVLQQPSLTQGGPYGLAIASHS